MAQGTAPELFKKGESRFQTVGQPGCPAPVGFVIPRGGGSLRRLGLLGLLGWTAAGEGWDGTERAAAGC